MSAQARVAGFVAVLAVVFAAAVGIGSAIGPTNRSDRPAGHRDESRIPTGAEHRGDAMPQGLSVANDRLRLVAQTAGFTPGRRKRLSFRVADPGGATVRDFELEHAKRMHLIVVRRDLTRYVHVHPVQQPDGSWTAPLRFADPGTYRVFADFTPRGGARVTLGTDLIVPGESRATPIADPVRSFSVDGYDVAIRQGGRARDGRTRAFTVTRRDRKVAVEPYLGADGHLVALREGDLAYLHAHPVEQTGSDGSIRFAVEYPSAGRYRLFLQFRHQGKVHTAEFTQEAR